MTRFPAYLRSKVQAGLTLLWTLRLPLIQWTSPARLVSTTLQETLGGKVSEYTYVDFCAGAGGPTPYIEQHLNKQLELLSNNEKAYKRAVGTSNGRSDEMDADPSVDFVLTDIAPHLEAWEVAAKKSDNLHFIPTSVDAANAPPNLLRALSRGAKSNKKVFRLFNLAFHHFDDPLAEKILRNTLATSDGFGIFELQARTLSSFLTITLIWPLMLLVSPFYFWDSPRHLFFTYIIPIIPFVMVFDGYVSSLRTRSAAEVMAMIRKVGGSEGWEFRSGSECHTYPTGEMTWFIGVKKA
ncbi:MAG: hypothetical protein Q9187_005698 [Circinaria calcarea]